MTRDLLINLIAAAIAFVVGIFARSGYQFVRKRIVVSNRRRIQEQRRPIFTRNWLVGYYIRRNQAADLYAMTYNGVQIRLPLLMKPSWTLHGIAEDKLVEQSVPQRMSNVPVNRKILKKRGRYLQLNHANGEPWNDLIACVAGVHEGEHGPRIRLHLAEYFQYLSACAPLEDETFRAVRKRNAATPVRDRLLASVAEAADCRLGAHPLGMQVAVVFDDGEKIRVLIQRRSYSVSSYGGALAVVPVFGCQTVDLSADTEVSLFHNFLREVYEELYGGIEVERKSTRLDAKWFYREAPIQRLLNAEKSGLLDFRLLGFGFDALNGEMDLQALAFFRDSRFSKIEIAEMETNWEINDIQIWDLYGQRLTDAMLAGEFSAGSVFAINQSREYLTELQRSRS